jgi:predicted GH43/DUF377 family glycosyl hydrolase
MSSITFVTAFFNIYKHAADSEIIEKRFDRFKELADTGIQICLYTEPDFIDRCILLSYNYSNIIVMSAFDINKSAIAKVCNSQSVFLPNSRCQKKDNEEFMIFINSKYELLENVISENPWKSTHFAWIDFSITYIFNNLTHSQEYLRCLSKRTLKSSFFAIGGWEKEKLGFDNLKISLDMVNWRFCGGFFVADKESMTEFIQLSKQYYSVFMNSYKKLTWEVNFWSWLETFTDWTPTWFHTMFNDGIIRIPTYLYCQQLKNAEKIPYSYPQLENFYPSSISHIFFNGVHILNTRFINYLLLDNGFYYFCDKEKRIITKNMISTVDNNTFLLKDSYFMDDNTIELKQTEYPINCKCEIFGLEDIRLYEYENKIKFIATNRNYSPIATNRMIVGEYNSEKHTYEYSRLIDSPCNSQYEKNWIPVVFGKEEYFIYKWCPLEIYKINYNDNTLRHVHTYTNTIIAPNFDKVRGSSTFIEINDALIGVVHFSDDCRPRKYYHMLVSLDKNSLKPLKYSEPFCFHHIGVEFCTGFWHTNNEYIFWVSKMDRSPCIIRIPMVDIQLHFSFGL